MNKRGQIYILMAIIFSFVIYTLSANINTVQKTILDKDFVLISENFEKESGKFLNALIREESSPGVSVEVIGLFNSFTGKFTSYSKTINPGFGYIYFYDYSKKDENEGLIIGNHLDQEILVWVFDEKIEPITGCKEKINAGFGFADLSSGAAFDVGDIIAKCSRLIIPPNTNVYNVNYLVGNIQYATSVKKGIPEIVILSEERNKEERRVYTNKKFEKGESGMEILSGFCLSNPDPLICNCDKRDNKDICLINDICRWDDEDGCIE